MPFVFKIKYESGMRRVIVKETKDGKPDLNFKDLEAKIRDMFRIPDGERLIVTYSDRDNEIVTMGDDFDLHDACIIQRIDPLRMEVNIGSTKPNGTAEPSQIVTTVQAFKGAVEKPLACSYMTLLPNQLLDNVAEGRIKAIKEYPCASHRGIECGGCGTMPLVGPQLESSKKEGDDICLSCFTGRHDLNDYQRIDKSLRSQRRRSHHNLIRGKMARNSSGHQSQALSLKPPRPLRVPLWKQDHPDHEQAHCLRLRRGSHNKRFDSRFVQHLSFFDGAEVNVGTCFTKSWRLRNTGILPWPCATQLVCVGGDVMGSEKPSSLAIPKCGLFSEEEIDASVDLVVPKRPGRFVSYWRLMSPTGQKFGQRIWVLIQAISNPEQDNKGTERAEGIAGGKECSDSVFEVKTHSIKSGRDKETLAKATMGIEAHMPLLDVAEASSVGEKVLGNSCPMQSVRIEVEGSGGVYKDTIDIFETEVGRFSLVERSGEVFEESVQGGMTNVPPLPSSWLLLAAEASVKAEAVSEVVEESELDDCQEDIILGMLNSMGFTQRSLNLELLRKNKNDMQGTVDDLAVASEWDDILDDLEEMGFYDVEMNRRLLSKNNGSLKLVVKELLQMETSWGSKES